MLTAQARGGEELGFEIISVNDHIVIPNDVDSRYPYSETGEFGRGSGFIIEQLTTLSFLGAATSSAKLMTSVMVLPHRNPVHTAKILATIDVLTDGRLIVGCGVGWMREEFEAIGAPPFDERGKVGDEYIRAFNELWTSNTPTFQGQYCSFQDIVFEPKPVQKPHPPIWVGGESPRRCVAPPAWATAGFRWQATQRIRWTHWTGWGRTSLACAATSRRPGATHPPSTLRTALADTAKAGRNTSPQANDGYLQDHISKSPTTSRPSKPWELDI